MKFGNKFRNINWFKLSCIISSCFFLHLVFEWSLATHFQLTVKKCKLMRKSSSGWAVFLPLISHWYSSLSSLSLLLTIPCHILHAERVPPSTLSGMRSMRQPDQNYANVSAVVEAPQNAVCRTTLHTIKHE